jgi:hypothetical protein
MSPISFVPSVEFDASINETRTARGSRMRGILSGLLFLVARVPFYVGAALLAAVVCVVGVALFVLQAGLGGRHA